MENPMSKNKMEMNFWVEVLSYSEVVKVNS